MNVKERSIYRGRTYALVNTILTRRVNSASSEHSPIRGCSSQTARRTLSESRYSRWLCSSMMRIK